MKATAIGATCGLVYLFVHALTTGLFTEEPLAFAISYLGSGVVFGGLIGYGVGRLIEKFGSRKTGS